MSRPRTQPYKAKGIRRVPCARCGAPSVHQWQVCADGNQYRGVCDDCDLKLNAVVLEFMRIPNREELLELYAIARRAHG